MINNALTGFQDSRGNRGGDWLLDYENGMKSSERLTGQPGDEIMIVGFRLAAAVPVVPPESHPAFSVTRIRKNGSFWQLNWESQPGSLYTIEVTENLTDASSWESI